ncbi:hypothetical protein [Petroclostridium sp. X23]|nr:hypothetical protein [Petroclostridium sp. X23]WHH58454.1 hypothetical protein QKW49_22075 [Petroclostridium sp. X23]
MTKVICECGRAMDYFLGMFHCKCGKVKSIFEVENYIDGFKKDGDSK